MRIKSKKLVSLITAVLLLFTSAFAAFAVNSDLSGVSSVFVSADEYAVNDMAVFTVKTGTDITKVKLVNDDGSTFFIANIDCGFSNYADSGDVRTWTISKKVQFTGSSVKTVYAGNYMGYSPVTATVTVNSAASIPSDKPSGFIRAKGSALVDDNGREYLFKGMAFGNNVWDNPSKPVPNHHTEDSYREMQELGFNSVRFYLNYGLFESDSAPYQYKQSGWDYLDENIRMAKKYNIRLVLNMHYPQGGYQSLGKGMALWTVKENQDRLTALWQAIALRYRDEPAIAAFDLVNEPVVPELATHGESLTQWKNLAQRITDAIREVDNNHLIIVERLNAIKNLQTGEEDWSSDENMNFFLIDDDNVMYEFHDYDPFYFTHQNGSWTSQAGLFGTYPDESHVIISGEMTWLDTTYSNPKLNNSLSGWQQLDGIKYASSNPAYNAAQVTLQCQNLGVTGKVWFDDIVLKEYDEAGNYVRDVYNFNFDNTDDFRLWSENSSGYMSAAPGVGHDKAGSVIAVGTTSDANIGYMLFFIPKQGYSYQISGFAKGESLSANATVRLRVDFWNCEQVDVANKAYLENSVKQFLTFGEKNNVPLYLGEFGVIADGFAEKRGGEQWVKDMLEICKKYKINFNYHTYHESAFGLYLNDSTKLPDNLNRALWDTFKENL